MLFYGKTPIYYHPRLNKKYAYGDSGKVSLDISGLAEGEYHLMVRGVQAGITYTINTSTGSGFAGSPIVLNGAFVGFVITNNGKNYANTDIITISQTGASGATATLVIGPQSGTYPSVPSYLFQRAVIAASISRGSRRGTL